MTQCLPPEVYAGLVRDISMRYMQIDGGVHGEDRFAVGSIVRSFVVRDGTGRGTKERMWSRNASILPLKHFQDSWSFEVAS